MTQPATAPTSSQADRLASLLGFLDSDPGNLPLLADAAEAALDAGQPDTARALLDRYAAHAPLPPRERNLAGLAAMQAGRFDAAADAFRALIAEGAEAPGLRFNLAWSLAMGKDFAGALEVLDDASASALPQAAMLRVQLLHQAGDIAQAEAAARDYMALYPDDRGLMAAISVLAIDIEDEELAAKAAAIGGDHPDALTTQGTLALGHDNAVAARALFDQALARNPAAPRALIGRGLARMLSGETAAAPADLDRGAEIFATHLGSWIGAGWSHFVNGDRATARARFETALAIDDTFAETHGSLAVLDMLDGDSASAERRSAVALKLDRQCYSAALARTLLAAARNDPATAQRIFDRALHTPIDGSGRTIAAALAKMGMRLG